MTTVFEAVSAEPRRQLLERLRQAGPLSIKELAAPLPMTRQAVTKHLEVLEHAGLTLSEWQGRERLHRLNAAPLEEIDAWLGPYAAAWDRRLARLKRHPGESDDAGVEPGDG